jgi:hypothetical protein
MLPGLEAGCVTSYLEKSVYLISLVDGRSVSRGDDLRDAIVES